MSGRYLLLAGLICLASACAQEPALPDAPQGKVRFEANLGDCQSKVVFDNLTLNWEPGDVISVFPLVPDANQTTFTNVLKTGGKQAVFEGWNLPESPSGEYLAVYPQLNPVSLDENCNISTDFYCTQTVSAGTPSKENMILVATGKDKFNFRPLTALLKFTVQDADIEQIDLVAMDDDSNLGCSMICSGFSHLALDGTADYEHFGRPSITVYPEEGTFVTGEPYYICIMPMDIDGISLVFSKANGTKAVKASANTLSVKSGEMLSLGEFSGMTFYTEYPMWISANGDLSSEAIFRDEAQTIPIGQSFDLAANTCLYPDTYPDRIYKSLSPDITVTEDGKASSDKMTLGAVRVMSAVNPAVYEDFWLSFSGIHQDGFYWAINLGRGDAGVTNALFSNLYSSGDYSGNLVVPASITVDGKSYPVTEIQEYAFANCPDLVSVKLPEGIERIYNYSFNDCPLLESVNIPASLEEMPYVVTNDVFCNNPKLTVTSVSSKYPVDEYGNLYENIYGYRSLIWLCEKTTGQNRIHEETEYIGEGTGIIYSSQASSIHFPSSLDPEGTVWVNLFKGSFPNLEEISTGFTSYSDFNKVFKYFRNDSQYSDAAGRFATLHEGSPIRLSVPSASLSAFSSAVADYGFSQVVGH